MLFPGKSTGSWLIDDLVGLGMPRTYKARHVEVGSECRLKVLPRSETTLASQKREVQALRTLEHDSVPDLLDYGVDTQRNIVWTAFAWFDADPLEDQLLSGPLTWQRACALFRTLADAISHVHACGLLHRDLRPKNVLLATDPDGEVESAWLTGFDYAMTQHQLERLLQAPFGDLAYLAPEVLNDPTHHGAKADVYAFGCLMFEVLTAEPAFPAAAFGGERRDQAQRMLDWKARSAALDPGPECPDWLRNLVGRCTEPYAPRRLPDIDALVGWLDGAEESWRRRPRSAPAGAAHRAPPPILLPAMRPSLRPASSPARVPTRPSSRPVPRSAPGAPVADRPSAPPSLAPVTVTPLVAQYMIAGMLGVFGGMGFSAVLILLIYRAG